MATTRPRTTTEVAIEYVNAFNAHDEDRLERLYAESFEVENPLWEGTKNRDETVRTIVDVWATLPRARFELRNLVASGPTAVLELIFMWDDTGDGEVTRRNTVVDVFTVEAGRFTSLRAYMDATVMAGWMEAMGGWRDRQG